MDKRVDGAWGKVREGNRQVMRGGGLPNASSTRLPPACAGGGGGSKGKGGQPCRGRWLS
jgi:hypothetical protein